MAAYAFSDIKEMNPDGSVKMYRAGDPLDDLSKERIAHLLEVGAAANYDRTKSTGEQVQDALAESDKLKAKVAELEAKLAEASKAQPASTSKPTTSSSATK